MPQDPHLYGQRPAKKQKRGPALSTSLDFTAQLTSLMTTASAQGPSAGRPRPGKEPKDDIFRSRRPRRQAAREDGSGLALKEVTGTEEEAQELERSRRRMEDKARRYAAMKRGDYVPQESEAEPLVDFDRKWAEGGRGSSSSDGEDGDGKEGDGEDDDVMEWDDEFGRRRRGTRADKERMERQARRGLLGVEELQRMSARPAAPGRLIYGDAVQALAFNPEDPDGMAELARRRDRSATPPEMKHYDADSEVRTKGVAFYKFSKDEGARAREMEALDEQRRRTGEERRRRDEERDARRRDMEARRRDMRERRAQRQADSFLQGLE